MTSPDSAHSDLLIEAKAGNPGAFGELLQSFRDQLMRIVKFRMDPRLRGRLDAADIVQEAFIEATERFDNYVAKQEMPFFLWLRFNKVTILIEML